MTSVSLFSSWMNWPRAAAMPALAAAQNPPFGSSRHQPDLGMMRASQSDRVVGRAVVDHDDLDGPRATGGQMAKDALQAGLQQVAAVVGRDHDRAERPDPGGWRGIQAAQLPVFFGGRDRFHEVFPQATC